MTSSLLFHFLVPAAVTSVLLALQENRSAGGVSDVSEMGDEFAASLNAKDVLRATSLYVEDAVLLPPNGELIRGLAAIEACWKQLLAQGLSEIRSRSLASGSDGDLGFETGEFELTIRVPGGPIVQDRGKYLNVLRRGTDGRWRITYDMWNSSSAK
jgi:ketosteroid isomerase-like protein